MTEKIKDLMNNLHCTEAEAIEIIKDDEAIDKGEKLFELTDEQKKNSKKARSTGTRKVTTVHRERKIDETKKRIMNGFRVFLEGVGATVDPMKTEAEIHFKFNGEDYSLKLIRHRAK